MGRVEAVAAATLLFVMAGCGARYSEPAPAPAPANLVAATVPGLAAAIIAHFDADSVTQANGGGNEYEKWMSVDVVVEVAGKEIPLDVMSSEYTTEMAFTNPARCPEPDEAVLSCRTKKMDDGSTVVFLASTEDMGGGIDRDGFSAHVIHVREHELVSVTEDMASRDTHYVDLTELPVDVDVLEDIATDPLVGSRTSPELNEAGKTLDNFHEDR